MSATRKKLKRTSSPGNGSTNTAESGDGEGNTSSAWLSASGLPPELLLDQTPTDSSPVMLKKKKEMNLELEGESASSSPLTVPEPQSEAKTFCFKDQNFVHSSRGLGSGRRTRVWKTLKQIIASEKALPWGENDVTYGSIEAPPSFKPAKKYSDLSGLPAKYTDPQTKLRYATPDEFARIRVLPSDIVSGYLGLRKANQVVP